MKVSELVSLFKVGFKGRFLIGCTVVVVAALFNVFPQPFARLTILITFLLVGEVFILTNIAYFVDRSLSSMFIRRNVNWQPVPDWLAKIAENMKVKVKKFGIKEGLDNAYSNGTGTVIIGQKLCDRLTRDALIGVAGHELAHIKKAHVLKMTIYLSVILCLTAFSFVALPAAMACLAMFAYITIAMIPFSWWYELQADALAANTELVGVERVKTTLLSLAEGKNITEHSETHPSIATRIKKLDRLSGRH